MYMFLMSGFFHFRYQIVDLKVEEQFVVNAGISICLESDKCEESFEILRDARLPKPGCNWNASLPGRYILFF